MKYKFNQAIHSVFNHHQYIIEVKGLFSEMRILYMQKCNENIEQYQNYLSSCKTHFKLLIKCLLFLWTLWTHSGWNSVVLQIQQV